MIRLIYKLRSLVTQFTYFVLQIVPYFKFLKETKGTQTPATLSLWLYNIFFGKTRGIYWPVHPTSIVSHANNIYCGIETSPGLMPGCYIQGLGKIYVGDYTQIASNVGIVSANHSLFDNRKHEKKEVRIGRYCWIGMGAVILPGVVLGDYTVVAAGSVVSKSFSDGYCVIGGVPAKIIKMIDKSHCIFHRSEFEYNGYIPAAKFENYRKKYLNVDQY